MPNPIVDSIVGIVGKIADKFIPDASQKEQFLLEMNKQAQTLDLSELNLSRDTIVSEAGSTDKWTSRARPSFLYVMYLIILASIPMGIVYAVNPVLAANVSNGFKSWLGAIPDSMWALFGTGYLGYSASRSYDKFAQLKHGK